MVTHNFDLLILAAVSISLSSFNFKNKIKKNKFQLQALSNNCQFELLLFYGKNHFNILCSPLPNHHLQLF